MLQTNHWHITDCRSPVGQLVVCVWQNLLADSWTTVSNSRLTKSRQSTNSWRTVGLQVFFWELLFTITEIPIIKESQGRQKNTSQRKCRKSGSGGDYSLSPDRTVHNPSYKFNNLDTLRRSTFEYIMSCLLQDGQCHRHACQSGQSLMNGSPSLMLYQISSCACFNCSMLTSNRNTWNLNSLWILAVVLKLN